MATRIRLVLASALVVAAVLVPSAAAGTLDQSQPVIRTTTTAFVSNFFYEAQTFTSGLTGALDQVDLVVGRGGPSVTVPLRVEILSVSGGVPAGQPLASTSIPAASVPNGVPASAFLSIPLSSPAPVTAGIQYAIVASSESCGFSNCYGWTAGPVGDSYAAGAAFFSTDQAATWAPRNAFGSLDFPFKTYVLQAPTSKHQCKKGGWRKFENPSFKNQGQCVKYVNHHGGKAKGQKDKGDKHNGGPGTSGKKKGGKKK